MSTKTKSAPQPTTTTFDPKKLELNTHLSRFHVVTVKKTYTLPDGRFVAEVLLNGEGKGPAKDEPYLFSEDSLLACWSGTHYTEVKEVTATELASLVNDVNDAVFTVEFHKQWAPKHTSDVIMNMTETERHELFNNQTKLNRLLSKTNVGDYRSLTGIKPTSVTKAQDLEARPPKSSNGSTTNRDGARASGLLTVVDLDKPAGERLRHINLKSVFSLIYNGTKYIQKNMKSHSQN